jgi:hypothetical protein
LEVCQGGVVPIADKIDIAEPEFALGMGEQALRIVRCGGQQG